jgi:hypothetical protein
MPDRKSPSFRAGKTLKPEVHAERRMGHQQDAHIRDDGERLYRPILKVGCENFPKQADSARHLDLMEAHATLQARLEGQG